MLSFKYTEIGVTMALFFLTKCVLMILLTPISPNTCYP